MGYFSCGSVHTYMHDVAALFAVLGTSSRSACTYSIRNVHVINILPQAIAETRRPSAPCFHLNQLMS